MNSENFKLRVFEARIGHGFTKVRLLRQALTHRSVSSLEHNERLEFLGDQVLGLVVSRWLYLNFSDQNEGQLSKLRSMIVNESYLANVAREIGLGEVIFVDESLDREGIVTLDSVLSDSLEALIAAIYLDSGMIAAEKFLLRHMLEKVNWDILCQETKDFKTLLQEKLQGTLGQRPEYRVIERAGPVHAPHFTIGAFIHERQLGAGSGPSKKIASRLAAKEALLTMEREGTL